MARKYLEKHFAPIEIPALTRGIAGLWLSQYDMAKKITDKTTDPGDVPVMRIKTILRAVAEIWDTDTKKMLGHSRKSPESKARSVAILMIKEHTNLTDEQIAEIFDKSVSIVRKAKHLVLEENAQHAREAVKTALK